MVFNSEAPQGGVTSAQKIFPEISEIVERIDDGRIYSPYERPKRFMRIGKTKSTITRNITPMTACRI